jgi:hypothetical protein
MRERLSVRQVLKDLRRQLPELIEVARSMPALLKGAVQRSRGGRLRVEITSAELDALREEIRRAERRRSIMPIGTAILFVGLLWLRVEGFQNWDGWIFSALGAAWIVFAWRKD